MAMILITNCNIVFDIYLPTFVFFKRLFSSISTKITHDSHCFFTPLCFKKTSYFKIPQPILVTLHKKWLFKAFFQKMPVKNHPQSCIYRFLPWHTNREVMKNVYAIQLPWNGKILSYAPNQRAGKHCPKRREVQKWRRYASGGNAAGTAPGRTVTTNGQAGNLSAHFRPNPEKQSAKSTVQRPQQSRR